MDIDELAKEWLAFKRGEVGASTLYTYRRIIDSLLLPATSSTCVESVTTIDLQRILMEALTDRSVNEAMKTRAVLRGLFGYAHRLGLVTENPAAQIRLPRGTGTRHSAIRSGPSPADALSMSSVLDPALRLMPLLAAFAGLRWQEVAALRPTDLVVTQRVISVERALGRIGGVKEPKSAAGRRKTVWANEITTEILDHVMRREDSEWLFTTPGGSLPHYSNWRRRVWIPACSAAGLSWTFHEYRHTFAVESLRRGRSVQSVAAMMGHVNPRVTWEFYAGLFEDHLAEAREKW